MRKAICLLAVFVLLATSLAAATSQVNNITLSHQNGYTQARIDVDGTVRFSHQTEVAKDGKPFRVIVDILKATHHLGAKKFMSLPKCAVSAIRTSQYAVKPEAVVRVVFDMTREASYRVESDQQSVTVIFPDKGGHKFAAWSSSAVVATMSKNTSKPVMAAKDATAPTPKSSPSVAPRRKTPAEVNSAIDKDRLASLASKNQPPVKKSKPTKSEAKSAALKKVSQPEKPTPFPTSTYTPGMGQFSDQDKWADLYKKPAPPVKKAEVAEVKKTKKNPSLATADQPPAPKKQSVSKPKTKPAATIAKSQPKPASAEAPKTKVSPKVASTKPVASGTKKVATASKAEPKQQIAKKTTKPPTKTTSKVVAKVDRPRDKSEGNVKPKAPSENTIKVSKKATAKSDSKTVAKVDKSNKNKKSTGKSDTKLVAKTDKADKNKKSTSRFRRSPSVSKKIKGTMVAEFPKRLVVKYKTRHYRDPFATLINDAQVSSNPIEQKIPNVEGLRLVGILESEGGKNSALLEDASGYGYILKSGDRVRKGYVLRIASDRVYFQIFEYGWSRTLALHIED